MTKGFIMVILSVIGILLAIGLLVYFHLHFKKKEKEILKRIEIE